MRVPDHVPPGHSVSSGQQRPGQPRQRVGLRPHPLRLLPLADRAELRPTQIQERLVPGLWNRGLATAHHLGVCCGVSSAGSHCVSIGCM